MLALAIAFSGAIIALSILVLAGTLVGILAKLEELGHLFFAVARSNLSLELIDRELPIPEWLSVDTEKKDVKKPAKVINLLRSVKDKNDKSEV